MRIIAGSRDWADFVRVYTAWGFQGCLRSRLLSSGRLRLLLPLLLAQN
jgi:hypothetical protein